MPGNVFTVSLAAAALTTANAWDALTISANSSSRLEIQKIEVVWHATQQTSLPALGFQLMTGSTGASTGAAITPVNVERRSNSKSADFTATAQTCTVISTASASLVVAGGTRPLQVDLRAEPRRPACARALRQNEPENDHAEHRRDRLRYRDGAARSARAFRADPQHKQKERIAWPTET